MNLTIETLLATALALQTPLTVRDMVLNTAKRMATPACGITGQGIFYDRMAWSWRHIEFCQYEARPHAEVPRVRNDDCGKTTQVPAPWAREGNGFALRSKPLAPLL